MPCARTRRTAALLVGVFAGALPAQDASPPQPGAAAAVHLLERATEDRVEPGGAMVRRESWKVRILTATGLALYSQVGVAFLESNQVAKLEALRVTKPDGRELDLLATAPTDVAPVYPTELPIFSDLRMLRVAVPSLEVGDLLSFSTSVQAQPIAKDQVWIEANFVDLESFSSQSYSLDIPLGLALTVHVRSDFEAAFQEERREGRWIRRWTVAEGAAPEAPSPAATPSTAAGAPEKEVEPALQITSFRTWDEFGAWWSALAPPVVDVGVRAKAQALTSQLTAPKEKLRAIHRYVAQEIRYLGLPLGIARYRAREPAEVMRTGLGDCKDKVRLLASLAESIGIAVDPVLIYAGAERGFVEEAPSPLQFDHVITRARLTGEEIWLDPTAEMVPMGSLPRTSRGRPGVALVRSGESAGKGAGSGIATALLTTPSELPHPPSVTAEITGSIAASGLLSARVRWTFAGDDELFRMVFKYGDEKVRRVALENMRHEWSSDAKFGPVTHGDPNDVDRPFWIEYAVERAMPASTWRKSWEFWLPTPFTISAAPPSAADDAASALPLEQLELLGNVRQRVSARIELPEGVRVSPPVPMSSQREFADFHSAYRFEGRTLVLERELSFKVDAVPRSRFDDLRELRKLIASDYGQEFAIAAAPTLAPAEHTAAELRAECWDALEKKQEEAAERLCRAAIALDPTEDDVWNSLGLALERQQRIGEAKAAYEKQIAVDPRHAYAYANLGLLAWAAGDMQSAEKFLRQQVEIAPLSAFGYARLGRLLAESGRLDEAESLLRRAAKLDQSDVEALEDLLLVEAQRGRFEAVAAMVGENPALARGIEKIGPIFSALSSREPANWSSLRTWLQSIVADAEKALAGEGRLPPTRDEIAAVAKLAAAWEALARAALEEGRTQEALALANAAIDLAHSPSAIEGRSAVLRARGETEAANLDLAIAAELARPHAEALERRLARAVPVAAAREALIRRAQEEAWKSRSVTRRSPGAAGNQGEIWLLFRADGRLRRATPVRGSETVVLAKGLEADPMALAFPPANRARIPAKALAYCGQDGGCTLTLEPPGQTWMSMKE